MIYPDIIVSFPSKNDEKGEMVNQILQRLKLDLHNIKNTKKQEIEGKLEGSQMPIKLIFSVVEEEVVELQVYIKCSLNSEDKCDTLIRYLAKWCDFESDTMLTLIGNWKKNPYFTKKLNESNITK